MRRFLLEKLIQCASRVTTSKEIYVIGSQAIHGATKNITKMAYESDEADLFTNNPSDSDLIDRLFGEESYYHGTFKTFAQGVDVNTAVLPTGWQDRVNRIDVAGGAGLCIGIYDLVLSKYAAGREKDFGFIAEIIEADMLDQKRLISLVEFMPRERCDRKLICTQIERDFKLNKISSEIESFKSIERSFIKRIAVLDGELGIDLMEKSKITFYGLANELMSNSGSNLKDRILVHMKHASLNESFSSYEKRFNLIAMKDPNFSVSLAIQSGKSELIKKLTADDKSKNPKTPEI